jgi:predicted RNA-binding protein (virulence factor B family)
VKRIARTVFLGLAVSLGTVGCQEIESDPQMGVSVGQGLPREYGDLVAVTDSRRGWNLWFQKADQSVIRVSLGGNQVLGENVLEIPRR